MLIIWSPKYRPTMIVCVSALTATSPFPLLIPPPYESLTLQINPDSFHYPDPHTYKPRLKEHTETGARYNGDNGECTRRKLTPLFGRLKLQGLSDEN